MVYTGDTVMSPLVSLPQVWRANLLIMEVSYLDGDRTAAERTYHIHIQVGSTVISKARGRDGVGNKIKPLNPLDARVTLVFVALTPRRKCQAR